MSDKLYTVSLKGASQNQPWTVINADSADELASALDALNVPDENGVTLHQQIVEANATYQAVANVANPSGRAPAPAAAGSDEPAQGAETTTPARQRGAATPPASGSSSYGRRKSQATTGGMGGRKPRLTYEEASADCSHGERVRREGTSAKGAWVAYFCSAPKGDPNQCSPNFLNPEDDQEG